MDESPVIHVEVIIQLLWLKQLQFTLLYMFNSLVKLTYPILTNIPCLNLFKALFVFVMTEELVRNVSKQFR